MENTGATNSIPIRKKRWSRVSHTKVKTGCITCRIRKVKCDEAKPGCTRCANFGRQCDGYEDRTRNSNSSSSSRNLLPRRSTQDVSVPERHQQQQLQQRQRQHQQVLPRAPPTVTILFRDAQDYRYFRVFQDQTSRQLSGFFELEMWNRLIPQACESMPSIRHAVIAIAALDLTAQKLRQTSIPSQVAAFAPEDDDETGVMHHRYALQQYSRAIKQMRVAASQERQDIRSALIASLLIICFETFHGSHESALQQIETAMNMLAAWREKHVSSPLIEAGIQSPNPLEIEEELVQTFTRLDSWAMTFIDSRPRRLYTGSSGPHSNLLPLIPERFKSFREAWLFSSLMVRQIFLLCGGLHSFSTGGNKKKGGIGYFKETTDTGQGRRGFFAEPEVFPYFGQVVVPSQEVFAQLAAELEKYKSAFDPFWKDVEDNPTHKDYIQGATCQMTYLACNIVHVPVGPGGDIARSETIRAMHSEMLDLAERILAHPRVSDQKGLYCFESQVVAPVYSVVWKSPYPDIRARAINILLSSPRREGFWDSVTTAKVGQWLMIVDEEGFDGYVPQDMKITNVDVGFDLARRKVMVRCMKPRIGEPGASDLRSTSFEW